MVVVMAGGVGVIWRAQMVLRTERKKRGKRDSEEPAEAKEMAME